MQWSGEGGGDGLDFLVLSPPGRPDTGLCIAASRAGAIGALDLQFGNGSSEAAAALARLAALGRGRWGAFVDAATGLLDVVLQAPGDIDLVLLAHCRREQLPGQVAAVRGRGARAAVVASTLDEARAAEFAGADAVVAKGEEAGGWVGEAGAYLLLQQCVEALETPVWVQGGIGLHTAAACHAAGAAGVVLEAQLWLARESPLGDEARERIRCMDGSETVCVGPLPGPRLRVYSRPGLAGVQTLERLASETAAGDEAWREAVRPHVDWRDSATTVLAAGQDASFAADLAARFETVGGILGALREAVARQCRNARADNPLREGSPLAESHGTRYPVVQGPMTRVSDRAEFGGAVAAAGGLPLLALALMRGPESASLLERTKTLLGDRPWGVGILGFVPAELRAEQLDAIRAHQPPFALIAGGRPDQARQLEEDGIATYLHVPSPGLLDLYLKDGARRFVFEGRECGGHVGPRTSFVLWETMIRALLEHLSPGADGSEHHVLFAGGIHDAASAAMVAAAAAPLTERGVRIGVLVGTAYLFTEEAVRQGAVTERFQQAAVAGDRTVLLESGPGHATRCLPSPFADEFDRERRRLESEGMSGEERRVRLEALNIGRLRIATKGLERKHAEPGQPVPGELDAVEPAGQWERGMYMIGQAAAMRDRVGTLAELHDDLSAGSTERLRALAEPKPASEKAPPTAAIAIVGIGSILPGAPQLRTFWANILNGVDSVTEVPATRWDWRRYFDDDRSAPDRIYSRWGGFVDDVPFDPVAFGMPPNSLRSIEPFQLLGLLAAEAALRDAGYGTRPFARERASVILGAGGGGADLAVGYTVRSSLPTLFGDGSPRLSEALAERLPEWTEDSFPGLLMNVAAGRIANRLDLGGTNYTVDAACASSLASIGLGVRELESGTSDLAVAGGVDAIQNPFAYLCFSKTQALSPSGRCRPFDAAADGIAISEGFAAVVLKRLADAERDGDRIYAVIRGVGSASDGRDRSLTAPRPEGQMRALRRAYAHARCSPATVGLVEAHGTGTVAGDRSEVRAISTVYAEAGAARQGCAIGSVKSMIGHTKATAGVAGLIKAALALHHKVLPPTIGVTAPNPKADFPSSPFYVNTETRPWVHATRDHPRRAAVSAFGFGGTNFHAVLEEYTDGFLPDGDATVDPWPAELFLFRETSREGLLDAVTTVAESLASGAEPPLGDLSAALAAKAQPVGRERPALAIVADSPADLRAKLEAAGELLAGGAERVHLPNGIHFAEFPIAADGGVALLFPGQGSQSVGMAREVAIAFPELRESLERADRVLHGRFDRSLSRYVFPPPAFTREEGRRQHAELTETNVAQPALGAVDLGYFELLGSFGVEPDMLAGHSYGEFVALAAAGCVDEDTLLRLSEARGRFIREDAGESSGAMAAIDAGPDALAPLLAEGEVVLANLNAPEQTVVSGSTAAVEHAVAWATDRELRGRRLPVACAFHSPHVAPAQRRLAEELGRTPIEAPRIAVFSNTTGGPYPRDPREITSLLGEHLVRPVDFVREVEAMHEAGGRVFVETGPRSVLTGLVGRILGDRPHVAVPIDQPGHPGLVQLLHCLATLAVEGVDLKLSRLFRGRAVRRVDPRTLESAAPGPEPSASTWLVNGGRARPAGEALTPPLPLRLEGMTMNDSGGVQAPQPGLRSGEVIAGYQQVMRQFLETERSVMLAYLGAPGQGAGPPPETLELPPAPQATNGQGPAISPPATDGTGSDDGEAGHAAPSDGPVDIRARLLAVVSERTGYPAEMLDLDADLEADLGIDSIKRVEIAGTMAQDLPAGADAELDVEQLTASRTLREVIGVLEEIAGPNGAGEESAPPFEDVPDDEQLIGRYVLRAVDAPAVTDSADLAEGGVVVIVDDATGIGAELAERLGRRGQRAVRVAADESLSGSQGRVTALVHLAALGQSAGDDAQSLFLLAQAMQENLETAAGDGGAVVLGATRMGGAFGVEGAVAEPRHGAIPGLLKTLAREWPAVRVKAVDLGADTGPEAAAWLEDELLADDGLVEVGYLDGRRTTLELVPAPVAARAAPAPLDEESVLFVTGGARGITAAATLALAQRYRPTLVIVGRTEPADEEPATAGLRDEGELKRAIYEKRRESGSELSPAIVESEYRRIVHAREARENLARLAASGGRVDYRLCDVRDGPALATLVDGIYEEYGRIDGVIHGAGTIEDKLVADKRPASFERVMATKAGAALALAAALRPETLRFFVLFGSVSGRFGNRGQADYAAASEVVGKLARDLDRRWDARVVAVDWGPWLAGGMVTPAVRRQFKERGVTLIPIEVGTRLLEEELRLGRKGEPEVVIGGVRGHDPAGAEAGPPPSPMLAVGGTVIERRDGGAEAIRTLDLAQDLYLADHRLDGIPVFPFAAAMELMAATAASARPDLQVAELRRIHLLHGVTIDGEPRAVRVTATSDAASAGASTMEVTVTPQGHDPRPHFRATVELRERSDAPPSPCPRVSGLATFPMPVEEAYATYLFHGPLFQGIEDIEGMDERGATAMVRPSAPHDCLRGLDSRRAAGWLLDPILVDCALQMQVLWARVHWDVTLLPAQIDGWRRFAPLPPPGVAVRHELRLRPESRSPMCTADHWLYGPDGELIATLTGVQGVGSRALNRLASVTA